MPADSSLMAVLKRPLVDGDDARADQTPFHAQNQPFIGLRVARAEALWLPQHQAAGGDQQGSSGIRRSKTAFLYRVYTQIVTRIPGRHFLRNLVERRALVAQLVRRDFHTRYVGSAGGWAWGVIHPIVQLVVWYFIFVVCLKVTLPAGAVTQSYPMFLFCGFLPWMLFQETVTRSAGSLVDQSNLITRTVFPSEVVPVSIFLSSLIHHLIGLALFVVCAVFLLNTLSPMLLLLPLYMLIFGIVRRWAWAGSSPACTCICAIPARC